MLFINAFMCNEYRTFLPKINYLTYPNATSFQQDKSAQLKVTPLTGLLVFQAAKAWILQPIVRGCYAMLELPDINAICQGKGQVEHYYHLFLPKNSITYSPQLSATDTNGCLSRSILLFQVSLLFITERKATKQYIFDMITACY